MIATIANAFSVPEIRRKILFTCAILALYRLGAFIPVPGVNVDAVENVGDSFSGSNILGFLNLFSGGGLQNFAVFSLGIMPYITASIILQLLTVAVPTLEKLQKEGEVGQQKITQYTRYLTVALASAQSVGFVFLFRTIGRQSGESIVGTLTFGKLFLIVITLVAGTTLLMWMGELITQRGIGNGISLLIFASIIAGLLPGVSSWWTNPDQVFVVMMPFIALAVIVGIVFIQEGQRRIPVQYAKRVVGRRMTQGGSTYLPLRVNMAGVIPVIFAASIMAFPPTIGELSQASWAQDISAFFNPNGCGVHRRRMLLHIHIHLLLHSGDLQSGRPGGQPQEIRRVHPGGETGPANGRVPGPDPGAAHLPGRAVPGRGRGDADAAVQPDGRELLLRRHLAADCHRGGAGHREAARGAAHDA